MRTPSGSSVDDLVECRARRRGAPSARPRARPGTARGCRRTSRSCRSPGRGRSRVAEATAPSAGDPSRNPARCPSWRRARSRARTPARRGRTTFTPWPTNRTVPASTGPKGPAGSPPRAGPRRPSPSTLVERGPRGLGAVHAAHPVVAEDEPGLVAGHHVRACGAWASLVIVLNYVQLLPGGEQLVRPGWPAAHPAGHHRRHAVPLTCSVERPIRCCPQASVDDAVGFWPLLVPKVAAGVGSGNGR